MRRKRTEPYISNYLHNKGVRLGLPVGGNFELTARCNFTCPMCYVHLKKEDIDAQGKELTAKQWIELAHQAKERGLVFALLTGGEPFVRNDFFEIYEAMKEMGLLVSINSNGSMLEGEIRRKLIANPPSRLNVSLYGGCNETYKSMCGLPVFDKVLENIHAVKDAGIDVRLNVSITPYNCQDIEKIYMISQKLQVHVKAASYMYPSIRVNNQQFGCGNRLSPEEAAYYGVKWDSLRFSPEEFAQRAENMKKYMAVDEEECSIDRGEEIGCRAGKSSFWMTWDGRMLPCGMMPYPEVYPLEIGFDAAWDEIRRQTQQIQMPDKCTGCVKRAVCSVCAAVCVTETGAFNKVPEYVCKQTQATIEETWHRYTLDCETD